MIRFCHIGAHLKLFMEMKYHLAGI